MAKLCAHYFVSGRVQGVWFRKYTRREAKKLNLTGYVRNLPDGRVEVMACGEQESIAQLEQWLKQGGPPKGRVDAIDSNNIALQDYPNFDVR